MPLLPPTPTAPNRQTPKKLILDDDDDDSLEVYVRGANNFAMKKEERAMRPIILQVCRGLMHYSSRDRWALLCQIL